MNTVLVVYHLLDQLDDLHMYIIVARILVGNTFFFVE